jgi:hypothetical protein
MAWLWERMTDLEHGQAEIRQGIFEPFQHHVHRDGEFELL